MLPAIRNGSLIPATAAPVGRLSSLIDRFFGDDLFAPLTTTPAWSGMPLATWQDEHNVYFEIDVPGVTDKDVEVCVDDGCLVVKGERKYEHKEGSWDTRSYGRFEQRVKLPAPVDADKAEARLANGVLCISFPKSEEARPSRIALKTE